MDYTALASEFNKMTLEQLREVNRMVVNQINFLHRRRKAKAASRFKVGDLVEFVDAKGARKVQARVEWVNHHSITTVEIDGLRWCVPFSSCRLIGA